MSNTGKPSRWLLAWISLALLLPLATRCGEPAPASRGAGEYCSSVGGAVTHNVAGEGDSTSTTASSEYQACVQDFNTSQGGAPTGASRCAAVCQRMSRTTIGCSEALCESRCLSGNRGWGGWNFYYSLAWFSCAACLPWSCSGEPAPPEACTCQTSRACLPPKYCNGYQCTSPCTGMTCGSDHGVSCGACSVHDCCDATTNRCLPRPCAGMTCGSDDGVSCGTCSGTDYCIANHCTAPCRGMACGVDHGVPCGICAPGEVCDSSNHCTRQWLR